MEEAVLSSVDSSNLPIFSDLQSAEPRPLNKQRKAERPFVRYCAPCQEHCNGLLLPGWTWVEDRDILPSTVVAGQT